MPRNLSGPPVSRPSEPRLIAAGPAERMGPLAVLPVFLKLEGRRAIVAGGSDAAAWKAELLAAAGADVHVFAAATGSVMTALLASRPGRGAFVHHARDWSIRDFAHAALAIADADDEAGARAFACAARAAGVPCNVIDNPAHCGFQFGAIVNRSPAVIGISTDGAAPILGQAIRRRIETLLPPGIAGWAAFARRIRADIAARLRPGPARRMFWERLAETAFRVPYSAQAADTLLAGADRLMTPQAAAGRVTLVGAGPGDADLLTIKAMRALQAADVILHDDLVSADVLELARREAKRMLVGKRGGRPSCRQDEINALMLKLAKAGKHVVRLKSGDPMVFGRAGEEIAALEAQGIAVTVVPGVTAALAMASALGVSLTHRDAARSVRFVTGHDRNGHLPAELDWQAIADPATTTICYMGGRTAAALHDALRAAGLDAATPAAVAVDLGRPTQRLALTTLGGMAALVADFGTDRPMVIGIGRVFAQRPAARMAQDGSGRQQATPSITAAG